jgi:formylglycine-generating enzyme required for sulfatase activity
MPHRNTTMRTTAFLVVGFAGFGLTGCTSGSLDPGSTLGGVLAVTVAPYLILDLNTGSLTASTTAPDLTDTANVTSRIVFRAVDPGVALGGSVSAFGHQSDETGVTPPPSRFYIAVVETTRGQWQRIAGTAPWATITAPANAGSADVRTPAVGMSCQEAIEATTTASARWVWKLGLPTEAQWETACRAGTVTTYSWGESRDETVVSQFARVAETDPALDGPKLPATRTANPIGLYDMHGNVWEWALGAVARGGSWNDGIASARSANRQVLDATDRHATVGVRLVLTP